MSVALVIIAAIVSGSTLAYVLSPLLWPVEDDITPGPTSDLALEALLERRARAYQEIRELETDYQLGKLDAPTYAVSRAELEARAVAVLQALDTWEARVDAALARLAAPRAAQDPPGSATAAPVRSGPAASGDTPR
jgi:hypothetical protein